MLDVLLTALSLPLLAMTSNACVDPAITHAVASNLGSNGDLTTYDVAITVKNTGSAAEPSSLLQSVQVYQDATKVDQKGTPPLRAGGTATVHYRLQRSSEARSGSTHLRFSLVVHDPHGAISDCSTANTTYRINV
jgi:archaellum component FlaG (FlaF/FlaG flagellin family)